MRVLGISAFYHDSAAALVEDGQLVARRAGGALHPQEARCRLPAARRRSTASTTAGIKLGRRRLRRLLRQAVPEVRAPARDLSRLRAARLQLVPHGHAAVAEGEAVPEDACCATRLKKLAAGLRLAEAAAVRRASPEPRRLRLLPLALRGGGGPDAWTASANGRPRRSAVGQGNELEMLQGDPLPALARAALFGLHLLHRLQGQLRRVQGDGPRALWRAEVHGH